MSLHESFRSLVQKNDNKIIMVVLDGVGGLPGKDGKTELEAAQTPNLDALAAESATGLHIPVSYGITPGSGPGHLGIFGYDPLQFQIGRGVLEALGLGVELKDTDIAIRGNYATIKDGLIVDRRAGRIPTSESRLLTEKLQETIPTVDGVKVLFVPGKEHRLALVLRFPETLPKDSDLINDTDPQKTGLEPLEPVGMNEESKRIAKVIKKIIERAAEILKDQEKANYILLRGISQVPTIPKMEELFGLKALAIAVYPMYRGLAKLVGMTTPEIEGDMEEEIEFLRKHYQDYDFFFVHMKKIDSYGEDGNFEAKVKTIERFDSLVPDIIGLNPSVLIITGDHSTPSKMKSHSWHPVPVLLRSAYVLGRTSRAFTERECLKGELGILPARHILPLALANAGRLKKFGA